MKLKFFAASAFAFAAMAPLASHAADGTINFTGEVTAQTCTINGNNSSSNNFTVALPTVSASSLAAAGDTAGTTPFNIALSNCTPASGAVHTFFEQGPTIDSTTGDLILTAGGATNVQLHLQNSDFSDISLFAADGGQNSLPVTIAADGSATLPYYVMYKATGAATAGAANSSVMYTLSYQ